MTTDLTDHVVLVAGAAGAAGPPVVAALVDRGATVIAVDNAADRLDPVVEAANATGAPGAAHALVVDLLDEAATSEALQRAVAEHGRLDGLFHLVGGWRGGKGIVDADLADWAFLHDLLIRTLQHTTRATHDALVASDGRFAIVSTTQAQTPTATNAAYAAAKAAAETWTLAVADSFAKAQKAREEEGGSGPGGAAATVVQIKALLTDRMREERPDRKFPGYTHVDDLARELVALFDVPASELNSTRRSLTA